MVYESNEEVKSSKVAIVQSVVFVTPLKEIYEYVQRIRGKQLSNF